MHIYKQQFYNNVHKCEMFINEIAKALNVSTYKQIQTYNSPCARDKAGN